MPAGGCRRLNSLRGVTSSLLQDSDQEEPVWNHGGPPDPALPSADDREQALKQQGRRKLLKALNGDTNDESSLSLQRTPLERQALAKQPSHGASDYAWEAMGRWKRSLTAS